MRRQLREKFYQGLKTLELLIAVAIVIIIVVMAGLTIYDYLAGNVDLRDISSLETFLQEMLTFVVGIEFVKMLIFHNPERVIDVLIFATSRQLVVEHTNGVETIVRIVGIGLLFAIQRFLIPEALEALKNEDSHEQHPHR
ncbi:MAG: hypothetical protein HFF76_10085 [Oscillospiraceae bacterium]|jgi:hypothetical protein|nr:hypothetical protein [Oscillospiraceae bacterium]